MSKECKQATGSQLLAVPAARVLIDQAVEPIRFSRDGAWPKLMNAIFLELVYCIGTYCHSSQFFRTH